MRERLIKILNPYLVGAVPDEVIDNIADHLLDNGVILPPVKVGQTVYDIDFRGLIRECKVSMITQKANGEFKVRLSQNHSVKDHTEDELKCYVFFTREAAEAALKARENK